MFNGKKRGFLVLTVLVMLGYCSYGQGNYLFHLNPFAQVKPQINTNKRRPKTRVDFGLVFGLYNNDVHYTNTTQSKSGYTIGVKEEFPVQRKAAIILGADFYKTGVTFNSYFFAKGYSFLYTPADEIYNHTLSIDEFQFPVEYKFSFSPETKNIRTFYGLIGWVYRLLVYDNAIVLNTNNGQFVYEGQNNLTYKYNLFTNQGSTAIELGLGYQRNGLQNGNAFFVEFNFRYGISPIIYTGNGMGSNFITFTMNTFTIKVGLRL
jgi:hypothetical protein